MLVRPTRVELPRRIVACYLVFMLLVTGWLAACDLLATRSVLVRSQEDALLAYLQQIQRSSTVNSIVDDRASLQPLAERIARERQLLYCAFVDRRNLYVAHSRRGRVGYPHRVETGTVTGHHGQIESIRYRSGTLNMRAYSLRIPTATESTITLIAATAEPTILQTLRLANRHFAMVLVGPALCIALGGFNLHRMGRPMAAIEAQLRQAAIVPTLADLELAPVTSAGPSVLGWNRVVRAFKELGLERSLDQRVRDAIQALHQEKSDDILNSLADGIAVTNQDGTITFANQAMAAIFATDAQPTCLLGANIESCLGFDADEIARSPLFDPDLRSRQVVEEVQRDRGETRRYFRIGRQPIRGAQGSNAGGHVWTVRDVTQQTLADAMRDQFLDNATHELRTPLANIKAYAETLTMSDTIDIESQKEFCNTINVEATRLARFIDDLLSVSSMEAGSLTLSKQGVDLARLFPEVVGKVKPQMAQKGLEFETIFPAKYPPAKLDKDKVNVALVNLLGNAAKYTPDGGRVRFEVKITDREIRIEVEDTGVGIAEDELPRIYEKFFRSANPAVQQVNGTGLGLSLAHEVIKLHGGELMVQSTLGVGTTFIATLPLE